MNWRQTTVLETMIYYLKRFYLLVKGGEHYGHTPILQTLATVQSLVPVTESSTGSGTGDRARYRFRYRYRIALVILVLLQNSVPVGY